MLMLVRNWYTVNGTGAVYICNGNIRVVCERCFMQEYYEGYGNGELCVDKVKFPICRIWQKLT